MMSIRGPLVDLFGRVHTSLRISVTDRCNIRCFYCMPQENVRFLPHAQILSFEEITHFTQVVAKMGIRKLRITGGEPLLRSELHKLIEHLASIDSIEDIALTTNGLLLAEQAKALRQAGLMRINVSLDGLTEKTFQAVSRRRGLHRVLQGIFVAQQQGFEQIRLNTVAIRGITETEIVPLGRFARKHNLEVRFIEFMPLDADGLWKADRVLPGKDIRRILEDNFGPLIPVERHDPSQPALDYRFADGVGQIGLISSVSQPFCQDCNRLRITAEGQIRNCLFSNLEWDARKLLRSGAPDVEIAQLIHKAIAAKKPGHGIDDPQFVKPARAMYQIGG